MNDDMKAWETDETFLSRWLSGKLTEEELRNFKASPDYNSYVHTAEALKPFEIGEYKEEAALQHVLNRIQESKKPTTKTIPFRRLSYLAVAAAIALLFAFFWFRATPEIVSKEVFAQVREQVLLPDQSKIELQTGSLLRYSEENWDTNREVYLEGEAYFEVEKGQKFDIKLAQGTVSILGTRFLIREKTDSLQVMCFSGKVKLEAFGHTEILGPGSTVLALKNEAPERGETLLSQPTWLSDHIQLSDVPLGLAVKQLEEIYGIKIEGSYKTEELFNGFFPTQDVETALAQVFGPFNIEYELDAARNIVTVK